MTLEASAIISSFTMAVLLASVLTVLYAVERGSYLGLFALAWIVYSLRYLFQLLQYPGSELFPLLMNCALIGNAWLMLFAAYRMANLHEGLPWLLSAVLAALSAGLVIAFRASSDVVSDTLLIISAAIYIWVGIILLRADINSLHGRRMAGWAMIAWGAHKLDYPILHHFVPALPWAYFTSSLLSLLVAIGVLILFFEVMRHGLDEREDRYRGVFNNHHTIMLLTDPVTGRIVDANAAAAMFYGYPESTLRQMTIFQLTPGSEEEVRHRMTVAGSGMPGPFIVKTRLSGGLMRDVEVFSGPISMQRTQLICSVVHDVSDRVESEETLSKSEHRFRELVENIRELFWIEVPERGEILYLSPAYRTIYGRDPEDLNGSSERFYSFVSREDAAAVAAARQRCMIGQDASVTYQIKRPDGDFRWMRARMFRVAESDGSGGAITALAEDITQTVRSNELLLASEEKYRSIFNNTADAIFIYDFDLNILEANSVASERLGYSRAEFGTMRVPDILLPGAEPDLADRMRRLREDGRYELETIHVSKEGRRIPSEINSRIVTYGGKGAVLSVARDISERKVMDRRLRRSLREKVVLLKEIHHRVKNNLQVIDSLLRIQSRYVVDPRDEALFRMSENRVKAMAIIHEELYQSSNLSGVRMRAYLARLLHHLSGVYSAADHGVAIVDDIENIRLPIGDASPCALIVNELVTNSIKHAFPDGKGGTIIVRLQSLDEQGRIRLEVSDDGSGAEELDTVDSKSFGLTLVRSLAAQMNAEMAVDSESGTRFRFEFARPSVKHSRRNGARPMAGEGNPAGI